MPKISSIWILTSVKELLRQIDSRISPYEVSTKKDAYQH